jgi:hypothetical protein
MHRVNLLTAPITPGRGRACVMALLGGCLMSATSVPRVKPLGLFGPPSNWAVRSLTWSLFNVLLVVRSALSVKRLFTFVQNPRRDLLCRILGAFGKPMPMQPSNRRELVINSMSLCNASVH